MLDQLDEQLQSLLRKQVDSYEKLDVVLYLHGRGRPMHLGELARGLGLAALEIERTVSDLCASGLLVRQSADHVCVATDETVRPGIDALAHAYHSRPLTIVSRLSRLAVTRLRGSAQHARARRRRAATRR